jgi:hypothetical protein
MKRIALLNSGEYAEYDFCMPITPKYMTAEEYEREIENAKATHDEIGQGVVYSIYGVLQDSTTQYRFWALK